MGKAKRSAFIFKILVIIIPNWLNDIELQSESEKLRIVKAECRKERGSIRKVRTGKTENEKIKQLIQMEKFKSEEWIQ